MAKKAAAAAPEVAPSPWRSRIVGYTDRPVAELVDNPSNWRTHSQDQLEPLLSVLETVGVVQNVIYNVQSGRLVDGHARVLLARRQGIPSLLCTDVDLDEMEESLVLATYDPLSQKAGQDSDKLQSIISAIPDELQQIAVKSQVLLIQELTEISDTETGAKSRANPIADRKDAYTEKHGNDNAANVMQVVVAKADWDDLIATIKQLGKTFNTKNVTDTVLACINYAAENALPAAEVVPDETPAPSTDDPVDGLEFDE